MLVIPVAECLNVSIVINGGDIATFRIMLRVQKDKYPYFPKKYYHKPDISDGLNRGSAGDKQQYNLNHFIKAAKKVERNRLFKINRKGKINVLKVPKSQPHYIEIKEENAGVIILANLIIQNKWRDIYLLYTSFLPESIESIKKKPEWGWRIHGTLKEAFSLRIFDFLRIVYLHLHKLAPFLYNCIKHCPNMDEPMLYQSLEKHCPSNWNWFEYHCLLRSYATRFGYYNCKRLVQVHIDF